MVIELLTFILETKKDTLIIVSVLFPLIIFAYAMFSPHFAHPEHITHIAVHEAGFLIAGFLLSLTIISYFKTKLPRMLFSAAAFGVLTFAQGVYLFLEQNRSADHHVDLFSVNEIFDTAIVVMTVLFALGVFYNHRSRKIFI